MIEVSRTPRALRVTFRDTPRRNALANDDYDALACALNGIGDARCVLLQGAGNIYCAGNRLDRFLTEWPQPHHGPVYRFLSALAETPVPVIAQVRGAAVGIGATMLLHCDVVLCEENAFFCYPFISLGIAPEGACSLLLAQRIGWCRAAEILLSGRRVPATELRTLGLCTSVHDAASIELETETWIDRINKLPAAAVQATKALMLGATFSRLKDWFQLEIDQINRLVLHSEQLQKG